MDEEGVANEYRMPSPLPMKRGIILMMSARKKGGGKQLMVPPVGSCYVARGGLRLGDAIVRWKDFGTPVHLGVKSFLGVKFRYSMFSYSYFIIHHAVNAQMQSERNIYGWFSPQSESIH
ncbi:hypothetical protein TNCT_332691 [Trichonephila clavata]|uniref:Uncharacterized protein n=1 Tax=Trichonephila clavata TaxID=2740835 RepID=A0A8X6H8E1_TRICU|nr:hypothetical protein TNCT_332691 [Trichonephila clavata]